ncbi:hypothetical protein M9H77_35895 [Catharanthus roseus]|uniref:Uncharacterized protein n=1 Tax=Catharanthus roseus TaxID=4058 RepID=A0ACB9ZR38_CATRO|nr:hypothetical protein M9H77_35895 [Catharanthus roseus]
MQGRNTVEEVLSLSAKRGYTVFYRKREDKNVLSDIVVSTGPISKVREMRHLAKGTNTTKKDKSHWEHVSIAHQKIRKSSGSGFGFGSRSGLWSSSGSGNWKNVIGDGNCGYRVVADFVFGDEHQWPKVHRRMLYELEHSMNVYLNLVGSTEHHWLETPDLLYIIANALNLCVIIIAQLGSTTVLPLYSYLDRPGGTLVIGLLTELQHFIQVSIEYQ